ncbi:glycoside hydrolase family 71 protein [Coniophora puteana RWD-64-598 SS2]|uniref:Glycoside hydrolase family 71 protein n=1 Tax=Coniophora puteana (strain RWD-64-598) TaxID=741705 RepID=A0A5M3MB82_CONPW|nr:glycoside hydrolase family 71 protein [Coniophora puteana RWD-64-598 SS2]EIW76482.1 glycoside hydrolase family 71 protein [Coniophora puteana RWD-64-598 SS2]
MFPLATLTVAAVLCMANAASAKYVFAHFMAQNSYSYAQSDWVNDMTTAKNIGIDGFALNIANGTDYEIDPQLGYAYAAAEQVGFQLFYSFDMSYTWDAATIASVVASYASSSSAFRYGDNNNLLVSSYSGESYGDSFWSGVKSTLSGQGIDITFAPAFTSYRDPSENTTLLSTFPSIDGFFNWWSWPADVDANLTTATDVAYQAAAESRGGPYIMAVSPWQFKNLNAGSDTDWVEYSDTLWDYRWQQALEVQPDIVEIVTWNDYAESHYIGDINPNVNLGTEAPLYVDGFVHAAWRDVAQYYISWYKTGAQPSISDEEVVFWYRAYPKGVTCSTGSLPRNADFPADAVFAIAMLGSPATLTLAIGSQETNWSAPAGLSMGYVPFPTEDAQIPYIEVSRDGTKVFDGYGSMYVNQTGCDYYNFNPFVGKAPN